MTSVAVQAALLKYQFASRTLSVFPDKRTGPPIFLGLVAEATEVLAEARALANDMRNDASIRVRLIDELGDVLYYIAAVADELRTALSILKVDFRPVAAPPNLVQDVATDLVVTAGRVADIYKKALRDNNGAFSPSRKEVVVVNLGRTLEAVLKLAATLNVSVDEIVEVNLAKLRQRAEQIRAQLDLAPPTKKTS